MMLVFTPVVISLYRVFLGGRRCSNRFESSDIDFFYSLELIRIANRLSLNYTLLTQSPISSDVIVGY